MATSDAQALLLTVSADTSKALKAIDAINKRLSNLGPELERHGKKAAEGLEKGLGSINPGKALDKIFDSSKLAVLDEGSARLRIFGSALEPLGPLGITAAAGVAAFGISLEEAHKAMEYAEGVQHLAEVLGTTTDKVQELNYAAARSGVDAEAAKAGIEELTTAIGAYQSNVKDKRVASVFQALGISKAEARQWKDPIDGLKAISEGLEKVGSQSERVALARALRFPPELLSLLDGLVEKMKAAKANGAVIDAESVRKAAELNKQLAATKDVISAQLKEAFIELAPVVKTIADMMAGMAKDANTWLQHMINGGRLNGQPHYDLMTEDVLRKDQTDKALQLLQGRRELSKEGVQFDARGNITSAPPETTKLQPSFDETGQTAGKSAFTVADYNTAKADYDAMTKALGAKIAADAKAAGPGGGAKPLAAEEVKALPKDDSQAKLEGAQATLLGAEQKTAEAYQKLSGSLDEAYQNQRKAIDLGADEKIAQIEKQKIEIGADEKAKLQELAKVHTKAAETEAANIQANDKKTVAVLNQTETEIRLAQSTELLIAERDNQIARMKQAEELAQDEYAKRATADQNEASIFALRGRLAVIAKDRVDFERQALVAQQKADDELAEAKVDAAKAVLEQVKKTSPNDTGAIQHAQNAVDAAQANVDFVKGRHPLETAAFEKDNADPIQKYVQSIQDLKTEVQGDAVSAFQNLTSGLIDAAEHAKNLGDVAKNVFLSLVQEVLTQTLQKEALPGLEAGASGLLHILGLAGGGPVRGPGSSTSDSIPAMLSDGEYVVKASAARKHRALLEAINGGGVAKLANGGFVSSPSFPVLDTINAMKAPASRAVTVIQPLHLHAEGAVMTDEFAASLNAQAQGYAIQAARAARAGAVGDIRRAGYMGNLNQ